VERPSEGRPRSRDGIRSHSGRKPERRETLRLDRGDQPCGEGRRVDRSVRLKTGRDRGTESDPTPAGSRSEGRLFGPIEVP
jgi:hypothetical protein